MSDLGKLLLITGLALAGLGVLLWAVGGRGWPGHLPGDLHFTRGNFSIHVPLTTCLLLSALLTLLLWLWRK